MPKTRLKYIDQTGFAVGNVTGVTTFNANNGYNQSATLTGNIGISIINQANVSQFILTLTASGADRTITTPSTWRNYTTGLTGQNIVVKSGTIEVISVLYNGAEWLYGTRNFNFNELSVGNMVAHPIIVSPEYDLLSAGFMTAGTDIATLFTPAAGETWHLLTCSYDMTAWAGTGTLTTAPNYQLVVGAANTGILNAQALNTGFTQPIPGIMLIGGAAAPSYRPTITNANPLKLRCTTSVALGTGTITSAKMKVTLQLVRMI